MKRLLTFAAALFSFAAVVIAQPQQQIPAIPADKEVRVGQLENGMKYYLRHNSKQKNLADFYIVHDVGAIQENDKQQGLAHFLEHMAFNGTKNLPGKMLIEYLEKIGVKFGVNLNAGTSWDYTQYFLTDVPTVREGIVDSTMLILHDWSHFIALQPEEIDSERGVISEELRHRDGADWRSTIELLKALFKGTRYEHRNLIGHLDGLKSFKHSELEDFYHTWYRPDYQAVFIVGDIDVDAVEAKLKTLMADIPTAPEGAPEKETIIVPDNAEPIVSIFADPEMKQSSATLYIKHPALPAELNNTVIAEQLALINALGGDMANARLNDIAMKPDAPFTSAYLYNGSVGICPSVETLMVGVDTKDGELVSGMSAALVELERIKRHGFTEGELERAKSNVLNREQRAYTNRNDRMNGDYIKRYIRNFRFNAAMPDAETEWQIDSMIISNISLEQVNAVFNGYITDHNRVVTVTAPEKEGVTNPTEADVLAVLAAVKAAEIAPYADNTVKEPLIANEKALKGSPVKKTAVNETLGTTEWTLKNGLKVVVKPTSYKADEVLVSINTHAGLSNLSDEDYYTGSFLSAIISNQGVSKFSSNELRKQLSGKSAAVYVGADDYQAQAYGTGSPKDIETLLQLVYLYMTDPRLDKTDFDTTMNQYRSYVDNLMTNPDYVVQSELLKTLYNNNLRKQILSAEILDNVKFERLMPVYKTLFGNAKNFTVNIVGNIDPEALKPLVEKYIGSLPTSKKLLARVDDGVRTVKGEVVNDFKTPMQQPKVGVYRTYSGEIDYTLKNELTMTILSQALQSRYLVSIREEKGGTYGVHVLGRLRPDYESNYVMQIIFDTNEVQADELSAIVVEELQNVAANGPVSEDVEKTRQYLLKEWNNYVQQNDNWLEMIDDYYRHGIDRLSEYENTVKSITDADVQELAKKLLADGNMTYVIMRPEK